ncbi:MAG: tetratricopeptide repeat protein [Candidatus Omnitrophica bacterium]|nr:tetratricopeptide repeat protein [Candidatus Omnitrophota bacterium]
MKKKWIFVLLSIILIFVVWLIYHDAMHSTFHFDDTAFIIDNYGIRHINNIEAIWGAVLGQPSRFVGLYTFALNYHFHALNPHPYHVTNVLIHLLNVFFVWWFIAQLLSLDLSGSSSPVKTRPKAFNQVVRSHAMSKHGTLLRENKCLIGYITAVLFAVHPIQTQAVTYISQRFASLATLFYLISLCLYLYGRLSSSTMKRLYSWVGGLIAAVLGMLTKEIVITLPVMIIFIEFYLVRRANLNQMDQPSPDKAKRRWVMIVCVILLFSLLLIVPGLFKFKILGVLTGIKESASHEGDIITLPKYIMTQFRVWITFLRLLIFPLHQNLDYDYPLSHSFLEKRVFGSFFILMFLMISAFKFRKKYPYISFGIFWFFITLSANLIPRRNLIFEHKLYIVSVGFCFVCSLIIFRTLKDRKALLIAVLSITSVFAVLTFQRNKVWQNEITLWEDVVKKTSHKSRPYMNLGRAYLNNGEDDRALKNFDLATRFNPKLAKPYNNRGIIYKMKGDYPRALQEHDIAIDMDPKYYRAYNNRGIVYKTLGNYHAAIRDYKKALALYPIYPEAYSNLGVVYKVLGQYDLAVQYQDKALKIDPGFAVAYSNKAIVLNLKGDHPAALEHFALALKHDPRSHFAYNNRGVLYHQLKEYERALKDFNRAIDIENKYAPGFCNRGVLYESLGDHEQALRDYQQAIALDPEYADAYSNRGLIYKKKNMVDLAFKDFQQALKLDDQHVEAYSNLGSLYAELKKYTLALEHFNKALDLNAQHLKTYNNRGVVYLRLQRFDDAISDYTQVIQIKPDDFLAYYNRGNIQAIKQNYDVALKDFTQAITFHPEFSRAYHNRGAVLLKLGQYEKALDDMNRSLHLAPNDARAYFSRAQIYEQLKQYEYARREAQKAKSLGFAVPDDFLTGMQKRRTD